MADPPELLAQSAEELAAAGAETSATIQVGGYQGIEVDQVG